MKEFILVTGGCGFIGANLVPKLIGKGLNVRVLDNFSSGKKSFLNGLNVEILEGDVRDKKMVDKALKGVKYVIHLAASGSVVESILDPINNFEVNAYGTLNLLKASCNAGVSRFIFASTGGALIGNASPPVNENSLPKPISPYGASKLCGEGYCHAFAFSFGLHTIALRFANVYGPFSLHKKGAITTFIKSILMGKPIVIYGDGSASRDFMHVDDLCKGIILSLEKEIEFGSVLHLASQVETKIIELAKNLINIAKTPDHPIKYKPPRVGEVVRNFASFEIAKDILGFSPDIHLKEGLQSTFSWFQKADF